MKGGLMKSLKNSNWRMIALSLILLATLNTASGIGLFKGYYTGTVTWDGGGVSGATVKVQCPGAPLAQISTSGSGDYTILTENFFWSLGGVPSCTITVTKTGYDDYLTNGLAVIATVQSPVTVNMVLTRKTTTATVDTNVAANVEYSYNGAEWNDCGADGTSHSCTVYQSTNFRLRASASGYFDTYNPSAITWNNINIDTNYDITLPQIPATTQTLTVTTNVKTDVIFTYDNWFTPNGCDGAGTTSHSCTINEGVGFNVSAIASDSDAGKYINTNDTTYQTSGITGNTAMSITLPARIRVAINGSPISGLLSVGSDNQQLDGSSYYDFPITPNTYTVGLSSINYCDFETSVIAQGDAQSLVNIWRARVTVDNGGSLNINDAIVNISYDTNEFICPYDTTMYECLAPASTSFTITAIHPYYQTNTYLNAGLTDNVSPIISLTLKDFNLTVATNASPVQYTYDNTIYNPCSDNSDNTYNCTVTAITPFNVTTSGVGYLAGLYKDLGLTGDKETTMNPDTTLRVNFTSLKPVRGNITAISNVSPTYELNYTIEDNYNSTGWYYIPIDPAGNYYNISYIEDTGRYAIQDNGSPFNASPISQGTVTLNISEVTYQFDINLTDDNNNNAMIPDGSVNATYDGSEFVCQYSANIYWCSIPHNTLFNIKGSKDGYVTKNLYGSDQIITSSPSPGTRLDLERTVMVDLSFGNPIQGNITAISDVSQAYDLVLDVGANYNPTGLYYLPLDPTGSNYTISYSDLIGRYIQVGIASPVNASQISQETVILTINEMNHEFNVTVRDMSNKTVITNAFVNTTYDGSEFVCLYSTGNNTCNIPSSTPFNITVNLAGYVNLLYEDADGISQDSQTTADLMRTLRINLSSVIPTRGNITTISNVSPTYELNYSIEENYNSTGWYYIPIDPAGNNYTINYTDFTGRYVIQDNGSPFNASPINQLTATLNISEVTYQLDINLTDDNNNNTMIPDGSVNATYDGSEFVCQYSANIYWCSIPHNTLFNIKGSKDGYVTKNLYGSDQIITSTPSPGTRLDLQQTLKIVIEDDDGQAINEGSIVINNSDNTQTLFTTDLTGNNAFDFYYNLSAGQQFNAYYINVSTNFNYYEALSQSIANPPVNQKVVNLGPVRVWATPINVTSPEGAVSNYNVTIDNTVYPNLALITLDRTKHDISASKIGHTISSITINDGSANNGSPVNLVINKTLWVNVSDENHNQTIGEVAIFNYLGSEINRVTLVNGSAWVPVDPVQNANPLTLAFESDTYVDINQIIPASTINTQSTHYINLATELSRILTIKAEDYFTNEELTEFNVIVWNNDTTYCTTSLCEFNAFGEVNTTNVTISKPGYFNRTIVDQPTTAGTFTIQITPRAVVYLSTEANITIVDTKMTASILDDEDLMNVSTNSNGVAALPLEEDIEFLLRIWAVDYANKTIGPYTTTDEVLIIGGSSNQIEIESFNVTITGVPVITSVSYVPQEPISTDNINITVNATDVHGGFDIIDACELRIDTDSLWEPMIGDFDNYTITATKEIRTLSNAIHTIRASCHDSDGWSEEYVLSINVGNVTIPEDTNDTDTNETFNVTTPIAVRIAELKSKYALLVKSGLNTEEIAAAMKSVDENINTHGIEEALTLAESLFPLMTLQGGGTVKTITNNNAEYIARLIAIREDQPYTLTELKNSIEQAIYRKIGKGYLLNGEDKTVITLSIFSTKDNPDAIIADFNPGTSSAQNTIEYNEGMISYFKGLKTGENVFEYVIDSEVGETIEPIVFTMKELSGSDKVVKGVTGFGVGIPGVFEVPVIYLGAGAGVIALVFFLIKRFY